ncbi:MAG: hypothetical protein COB08_011980 [Rhodobacteraceae bacterium]|nr:hypothetical protein [Paracoccaceae bacterium]
MQAVIGDVSEVVGFIRSGDVRVLLVLTEDRLPGEFSNILTAGEQGVDVVAGNWRGLDVPKGISGEESARWSNAVQPVIPLFLMGSACRITRPFSVS